MVKVTEKAMKQINKELEKQSGAGEELYVRLSMEIG